MKKLLFILLFTSITFAQNSAGLLELRSNLNVSLAEDNTTLQLQPDMQKKKPGVAMIYSFLLPGMGEYYADGYDSGIYFTIADAAIWGTLFGLNIYGNWQKDNYKSFAQTHAGISPEGKNDTYYADISSYLSVDEFNNEKYLNRENEDLYNTETHYWQWESESVRKEYRSMWSSSEQAFTNVRFAVGALILNRVISMINAVRVVNQYNKKLESGNLPKVTIGVEYDPNYNPHLTLNLRQMF